jgi:hypothetical protein
MRGSLTKLRRTWRASLFLLMLVIIAGFAWKARSGMIQQGDTTGQPPVIGQPPVTGRPGGIPGTGPEENSPEIEQMLHRQAEARNSDRQKQLVKDTDKLYALATELKDEVAKSNKDTLSVEVIKKAEEIEKLAKSVREKMKAE